MAQVYVSIGSNIEPRRYIGSGLDSMHQHFGGLILSSVYESKAVGFEGDNFLNLVALFETDKTVNEVIAILQQIETNNDRKRISGKRFSARTLDLDILLYDNLVNNELAIPRDEILKYAFVLLPLSELAPDAKHPVTGQTYANLWQKFDKNGQDLWQVQVVF
jgi:2-amino-4-hydroxy-6-hydroxymethyldihydropteridine diphosphokinase